VGGDPFLSLGFGMSAYINTLSTLIFTFIVISIVTHPVLLSYSKGVDNFYRDFGFKNEDGDVIGKKVIDEEIMPSDYGTKSIANLGYSSIQCNTLPLN
jgi:hypothetical protein